MTKLSDAFTHFGIKLFDDLTISWRNSIQVPLCELSPKDIKMCLQHLARNVCYQHAGDSHRKDFSKPTGVLDFDLSTLFYTHAKIQTNTPFPAYALFENQLVGSATTGDRLVAAGLSTDPTCRFCKHEKESMTHLVDCPVAQQKFGKLQDHELGPNFKIFGLVEHPRKIAEHRLRWQPVPPDRSDFFQPDALVKRLWSDGSVIWNTNFWLMSGGFAVVDDTGTCKARGPVLHWSISSYTTELWAVLVAFLQSEQPICIFTDCQTIVRQWHVLQRTNEIDSSWAHPSWWKAIKNAWRQRAQAGGSPLQLKWIPSHVYDDIPFELITDEMLEAKGTTIEHIRHNRFADKIAKEEALKNAAVLPEMQAKLYSAVVNRHTWLTKLGEELYCDVQKARRSAQQVDRNTVHADTGLTKLQCENQYQKFPWKIPKAQYRWKSTISIHCPSPKKWKLTENDWKTCVNFCRGLLWREHCDIGISFVELAFIFWVRGFRLQGWDQQVKTFRELTATLRAALCMIKNEDNPKFFPGVWQNSLNHNSIKFLPAGCIQGAAPFFSNDELVTFCNILQRGAGKKLTSWNFFR